MDPMLDAQRRCLDAWREMGAARPQIHAHQLLAVQRESALANGARDFDDYRRRSCDGFELQRAVQLDRIAGAMAIAETLGDVHATTAARIEYRATLDASGPADWPQQIVAGARRAASERERSDIGPSSLVRCLLNLLMQHASDPPMADHAGTARAAWREFAAADPAAARLAGGKLASIDRLGLRVPWRGDGLALVGNWLDTMGSDDQRGSGDRNGSGRAPAEDRAIAETHVRSGTEDDAVARADGAGWVAERQREWQSRWFDPTPDRPTSAALADMPAIDDLLASYRSIVAGNQTPAAQRTVARRALAIGADAAHALDLQRRLTIERIPAALAAAALQPRLDAIDERQARWAEPLLARHAAGLRGRLSEARSVTEVELAAIHAEACLAIEADWSRLLMSSLLAPLQAAAMVGVFGAAAEPGLARACRVSHQLLGLGPRALLRSPALADDLQRRILPLVVEAGEHGSLLGEAGRELMAPLRGWLAMLAVTQPADGRIGPAQLLAASIELLDRCHIPEPPALERELVLWRRSGSVAHWDRLIATSSRPALPGWPSVGGATPPL